MRESISTIGSKFVMSRVCYGQERHFSFFQGVGPNYQGFSRGQNLKIDIKCTDIHVDIVIVYNFRGANAPPAPPPNDVPDQNRSKNYVRLVGRFRRIGSEMAWVARLGSGQKFDRSGRVSKNGPSHSSAAD